MSQDPLHLYHYTSPMNAINILESGIIKAQSPHGGTTNMPKGVYLTELHPNNSTKELVANNYDGRVRVAKNFRTYSAKTGIAFQFSKMDLYNAKKIKSFNRNVWYVPGDLDIDQCLDVYSSKDFDADPIYFY